MKKIVTICLLFFLALSLTGCFDYTEHPNMVEYDEEEILQIIKEEFNIKKFIFTSEEFNGRVNKEEFKIIEIYSRFSSNFINPVNIEKAFTSFAGKNGNHDIQGMYSIFLCYVALAIDNNEKAKFIYYNTNLDKDAKIIDTIGVSDYPYDVLPTEITNDMFYVDSKWWDMSKFLNEKVNPTNHPTALDYSKEYLSREFSPETRSNGKCEVKFYKENEKVVYDINYYKEDGNSYPTIYEEAQLIYSSSERYGVIYNYYGFNYTPYIDVSYTVEASTELSNCDVLKGLVKVKDFGNKVIYSQLSVRKEYQILNNDGIIVTKNETELRRNCYEFKVGIMIDRIEGVNHNSTANIKVNDFYILYEK